MNKGANLCFGFPPQTTVSPSPKGQVPEGGEGQIDELIEVDVDGPREGFVPEDDTWGPWSDEWSPCSRSCGGGVSFQQRKCITSRYAHPQRKESL